MSKEIVAIILTSKPNYDQYAFKYFILYLNKIQQHYEFTFPEIHEKHQHYFCNGRYEMDTLVDEFSKKIINNILINCKADYYINIVTFMIGENLFFDNRQNISFITTNTWNKLFSPPSLFEYLMHSTLASLIFMNPRINPHSFFHSHRDTRGCYLDYTYDKMDDKIDIVMGHLCDYCTLVIYENAGPRYLEEIYKMIELKWIGDKNVFGTPAYNLKKYFKYDIDKDSGFTKTFWEKIKDRLDEHIVKILIAIIGYIFGLFTPRRK